MNPVKALIDHLFTNLLSCASFEKVHNKDRHLSTGFVKSLLSCVKIAWRQTKRLCEWYYENFAAAKVSFKETTILTFTNFADPALTPRFLSLRFQLPSRWYKCPTNKSSETVRKETAKLRSAQKMSCVDQPCMKVRELWAGRWILTCAQDKQQVRLWLVRAKDVFLVAVRDASAALPGMRTLIKLLPVMAWVSSAHFWASFSRDICLWMFHWRYDDTKSRSEARVQTFPTSIFSLKRNLELCSFLCVQIFLSKSWLITFWTMLNPKENFARTSFSSPLQQSVRLKIIGNRCVLKEERSSSKTEWNSPVKSQKWDYGGFPGGPLALESTCDNSSRSSGPTNPHLSQSNQ